MKNNLIQIKLLSILMVFVGLASSCEYKEYADADFPDQSIYMTSAAVATRGPAATGFYQIVSVAVPDQLFRYELDQPSNRFNVNLGVGRSGVTLNGEVNVNITLNADTISKLLTKGTLAPDVLLLPASAINLQPSVKISSGEPTSSFPLSIDLAFLLNNPNKRYAIGVGISSTDRKVTPNLNTTIVLLNTAFLFPTANFSFVADATNPKRINFTNTSLNGLTFNWNFGNGASQSTERSPFHVFATAGTYNVTLTTIGVTGDAQKSTITIPVAVN